jgi:hypothetical protein
VIYYDKKVPLYDEASRLYNILKTKFEEKERKKILGATENDEN